MKYGVAWAQSNEGPYPLEKFFARKSIQRAQPSIVICNLMGALPFFYTSTCLGLCQTGVLLAPCDCGAVTPRARSLFVAPRFTCTYASRALFHVTLACVMVHGSEQVHVHGH